MLSGIILYSLATIYLIISFKKNKLKTKLALISAWKMFRKVLPDLLAIMLFVGLTLSLLSPDLISSVIGENSGLLGMVYSTILGSVALVPSFIVFPLGRTLVQNGAALPQVAVLMSTLMSVGLATLTMEQKIFGRSFAYARNASAIIMSLLFAWIVWVVMV
ncbi:hypothetical protein [Fictibacillus norfolkensis]|uniref:Permease n=1 Tax=Fictibacillus norfolkensis TaxID=2762233 RepID=A0ABR8SQG3_9BACL|nr:hypothetical protein [Fictibacillus norfolkensis]MBD7965732.1 hypothetical protein [Fictibacillus norfolkensis]